MRLSGPSAYFMRQLLVEFRLNLLLVAYFNSVGHSAVLHILVYLILTILCQHLKWKFCNFCGNCFIGQKNGYGSVI